MARLMAALPMKSSLSSLATHAMSDSMGLLVASVSNTHDDVLLFESEHTLCFYAKGENIELLAGFHDGIPHVFAVFSRKVNLPAGLAHEADAQHETGHARHFGFAAAHVAETLVTEVSFRQFGECLTGFGTGHVYRAHAAP